MDTVAGDLSESLQQGGEGVLQRFWGVRLREPFWYIGSLVLVGVWAVAGWDHDGTGLVVAAAGLLILSVIMSILVLVPINNRVKTWTAGSRPADWKEQLQRWDRWHYVRVAVIIAAFALLVTALT